MMKRLLSSIILSSIISLNAQAAGLIRDAEIEHTLRTFSTPIFEAASLNPANVRIFIVQDNAINAFVAGGQNIFLHTGLIQACDDPAMLIGVIAHETGHIAGGHLARGSERMRDAQLGALLSYVLGAAAVAGGGGQAGMAVISGGQSVLQRIMMSYNRTQEQSADQAALGYLDKTHTTAQGMVDLFAKLRRDERRSYGAQDPYTRTHPLSAERVEHVRAHVEQSNYKSGDYPKQYDTMLARTKAKLYAFMELPPKTFARYSANDKSDAAQLARAVAHFKTPDLNKALETLEPLLKAHPKDAFLFDLKGQIFFENGRIKEAADTYAKAAQLAPESPLILTSYAESLIATKDAGALKTAVAQLEKSSRLEPTHSPTWRLLATAYGRMGDTGMAALSLAEEAALQNKPDAVQAQADRALENLKSGPARLRAEDLKALAIQLREDEKKK